MTHHGSSIVLKTTFDQKRNRVLRTIFDTKGIYYQVVNEYVPPLFLIVNYEESAFTRNFYTKEPDPTVGGLASLRTDELLRENIKLVEGLLEYGDCKYDNIQFTFLRLETAGNFQRNFEKLYPLWGVGVGAVVRLSFSDWHKRLKALSVLVGNAERNQDVYTINYAANMSPVTVVDYIEPLFAHCMKLEKTDVHYDTDSTTNFLQGTRGPAAKRLRPAETATNCELFEINFCVIDEEQRDMMHEGPIGGGGVTDAESSVFTYSSSVATKKSGFRKRGRAGSGIGGANNRADAERIAHRRRKAAKESLVVERPRAMNAPLTVHDVRPYFNALKTKRLSRLSLEQLEELPIVVVRFEREFCAATCCVFDKTECQLTVLHVYYCWDEKVHRLLTEWSQQHREMSGRHGPIVIALSKPCTEDIEARLMMLKDLKDVIWKSDTNTYLRLAISSGHEEDMLARNIYEPLVFHTQTCSADLETEIRCAVNSSEESGSEDIFRNAVSLDCSRLCNELDRDACSFAKAYHRLTDGHTLAWNGSLRLATMCAADVRQSKAATFGLLNKRQELYADLVAEFRHGRILQVAFDMACELRHGLLDLFGLAYTEKRQALAVSKKSAAAVAPDERALNSLRVSNYVFIESLMNSSVYVGASGSAAACSDFIGTSVKPYAHHTKGLHKSKRMIEFDIKSAYPSVAVLYNISPETTAIVRRDRLGELDKALESHVSTAFTGDTTSGGAPTRNVMSTIYNQQGHLNDTNSNLVVVSLRPEIYVGYLARIMELLVLKRNSMKEELKPFYKALANMIYGCTGNASANNDLYSPQCCSSIASLCKSVMLKVLNNVPQESIIHSQTDGAVLQDTDTHACRRAPEDIVQNAIDEINSDARHCTFKMEIRVRPVRMCLVMDQNKYLMRYGDDQTVCKGQSNERFFSGDQRAALDHPSLTESLLSAMARYIDSASFNQTNNVAIELNNFLNMCFDHIKSYGPHIDWYLSSTFPSVDSWYSIGKFNSDQSDCKFGDNIVVWPTLVHDNGKFTNEFRLSRPLYSTAVCPNRVSTMEKYLKYWVQSLFTSCRTRGTNDQRGTSEHIHQLIKMFKAYCAKKVL